jgi:uncharacterized protein (DUF1330 family)
MAAYLIARIKVNDPETYDKYRAQTPGVVAAFGGKFIARGGRSELLEGDNPELARVVLIEFPSYEQAQAFYRSPQYRDILKLRLAAAQSEVVIVEGV